MYPNLRAEIKRCGLRMAEVADALGVSSAQFSQKINGHFSFTLREAFALKKMLKTKMSIETLFQKSLEEES